MLVFLGGYRGCGKSSLGRKAARRLGVEFIDTDAVVERDEGASVADIFCYEGEEYFRRAERAILERIVARGGNAVVSTGGGLPLWHDNMAVMNEAGITLYIRRAPEQIIARLTPYGRQRRPRFRGLSDGELLDFIRGDMAGREACYLGAQAEVDCRTMSDADAVEYMVNNCFRR